MKLPQGQRHDACVPIWWGEIGNIFLQRSLMAALFTAVLGFAMKLNLFLLGEQHSNTVISPSHSFLKLFICTNAKPAIIIVKIWPLCHIRYGRIIAVSVFYTVPTWEDGLVYLRSRTNCYKLPQLFLLSMY